MKITLAIYSILDMNETRHSQISSQMDFHTDNESQSV